MEVPNCEFCESNKSSLFHFCDLEEIGNINSSKSNYPFRKGQIIFQEGNRPLGLYCVYKGKIKVYKYANDGKEQLIRVAKAGDFLGFSSLLTGKRYPVSAAAVTDSEVCLVPRAIVLDLFRNSRHFSEGLINLLTSTIKTSYEQMAKLSYKPVKGRLAEALLLLHQTYTDSSNPTGIISITREDLASLVGSVKETIIRVLKEFKDDGYLQTDNSNIVIKDVEGLAQLSSLYE